MFHQSVQLNKNIQIQARNRPIKIAYIIPYCDTEENHFILDAIFHESYTRWGGARTLIIPSDNDKFLYPELEQWLEFFDADFIYTYVDLEIAFVKRINFLCHPIRFLKHKKFKDLQDWRAYLPSWERSLINPVRSISTLPKLSNCTTSNYGTITFEPTIITEFQHSAERFVRDNFGSAKEVRENTNPIAGLYRTLALVPDDLPENMVAGTERTTSVEVIISNVAHDEALTFAQMASACCDNVLCNSVDDWSNQFNIFIGDSCLNRISFWNSRHFTSRGFESGYQMPGSLIIANENYFDDEEFVKKLGDFLNRKNWVNCGGEGAYRVAIRSLSVDKPTLDSVEHKLKEFTQNSVCIPKNFNAPAVPTEKSLQYAHVCTNYDCREFKVNESQNEIEPKEPLHFSFIPVQFYWLKTGSWSIDLAVERHQNLSLCDNVTDIWKMPRRDGVARCFTPSLSKITKNHLLSIIPFCQNSFAFSPKQGDQLKYQLTLPDDETLFRYLLYKRCDLYVPSDVRNAIVSDSYECIEISDKGQNLRGVIAMFDSPNEAYQCLTNKFWREEISGNKNAEKLRKQVAIFGGLRGNSEHKKNMVKHLRLKSKQVNKYLELNLLDSLQFLVEKKVFFQVYSWRCAYCGNRNVRSMDELKQENQCKICQQLHYSPVDIKWSYKLNKFVYDTLFLHRGIIVLWVLGYLQDRDSFEKSFYFLPEVNLYYDKKRLDYGEIDLLCVMGGKFLAVEAKQTARAFLEEEEINKYIKKIGMIRPDKAILAFGDYGAEDSELEGIKGRLKLAETKIQESGVKYGLEVEVIVAADFDPDYSGYPIQLFPIGSRLHEFLKTIN